MNMTTDTGLSHHVIDLISCPALVVTQDGQVVYANSTARNTLARAPKTQREPTVYHFEARASHQTVTIAWDGQAPFSQDVEVTPLGHDGAALWLVTWESARTLSGTGHASRGLMASAGDGDGLAAPAGLGSDRDPMFADPLVGMVSVDLAGRCLECNATALAMLDTSGDDVAALVSGGDIKGIVRDDAPAPIREAFRQLTLAQTETDLREHRCRRRDGTQVWLQSAARLVRTPEGRPSHVLASVVDITRQRAAENTLRIRERAIEHAGVGITISLNEGDHPLIYANEAFERLTGIDREEAVGRNCRFLQADDRDQEARETIREAVRCAKPAEAVLRNYRPDGTMFWNRLRVTPVHDENGACTHFIGFQEDVTEEKRARQQERLLSEVVRQTPSLVVITNAEGKIEWVNNAFERVTGYTAAEAVGRNPNMLQSGETSPHAYRDLWRTLAEGKVWHGEMVNQCKSGDPLYVRAHITPIPDETGHPAYFAAVEEDITVEKQQAEKIVHQAYYDALTQLPNRALLKDRMGQAIATAKADETQLGVLFLDLDNFKFVNDTLGHEKGDELLVQAAKRLQENLRSSDTVARLGGDEFVVLMPGLRREDKAARLAEKILAAFQNPFLVDGRKVLLTASIGISIYPEDGETPADLLKCGDVAMYGAKREGSNTYRYFTADLNSNLLRQLSVREALRGALTNDEFQVVYQPVVSLETNRIVGAEALVRWQSAQLGQVRPDEFIAAAEENGMIREIGLFVMHRALQQAARWRRTVDADFKVAINVSPNQLQDPEFLFYVYQALHETGLPGDALEFEITETVLMQASDTVQATLSGLRELGIRLSLDDFGTGYASLSYLRQHPFDTLKIDKSFVQDCTQNGTSRELVVASLGMAEALSLDVVAEGIETDDQMRFLQSQGCRYGQGFRFAPPLMPADFSGLLRDHGGVET